MKNIITAIAVLAAFNLFALERQYIWPEGKMPLFQEHQFANLANENGSSNRVAYLEWFDPPENPNGGVMILISGGSYQCCCDIGLVHDSWPKFYSGLGFQCVNFVYRTPRPKHLPIYQTAWVDGQRAVRVVRAEAKARGLDPERIGVASMSAGSHLATLLATSSQTPAYVPVDELDQTPCHIAFAITGAIAYGLTTSAYGEPDLHAGLGGRVSPEFRFDKKTAPMCILHGSTDIYSPLASTMIYRELRKLNIPSEVHVWSDRQHGGFWVDNWKEVASGFIRQMNFDGRLGDNIPLMSRFPNDLARDGNLYKRENIWPDGKIPNMQDKQCVPFIEWHFPTNRKTSAVQIIFSGGCYSGNDPNGFEVAPARRFLNEKGMTVVTMRYRAPRPTGLPKHLSAWQDLQRAIRLVRSEASGFGLDPERIGVMGSSAGGHLALMGALSSTQNAYEPIDDTDTNSCKIAWAVGIYPAYALTDGLEDTNTTRGNCDTALPAPEFLFDNQSCPIVFVHGDSDGWSAMNSVKAWEKLRSMGIHGDLHTLAKRPHCFQNTAAEGTGSHNWLNRVWEFLIHKGFAKK